MQILKDAWNKAKETVVKAKEGAQAFAVAGVAALGGLLGLAAPEAAHAALPAAVTSTFTDISTNATAMFDLAFPIVAALVGSFVLIKLFKKFANKAT